MKPKKVTQAAADKAVAAGDAAKLLGHVEREDFEAAVAAGAVAYSATKFLGRGQYETRRVDTLEAARDEAKAMGVERVLIYAINGAGQTTLIESGGKPVKRASVASGRPG